MIEQRHWRPFASTAALVVAGLLLPAVSEAAWSPPVTVAHDGGGLPLLASSARRGSTVAWQTPDGALLARRIFEDGSLGPRRQFAWKTSAGPYVVAPAIAVGPSGATVAAWSDRHGIRARRMTRGGRLGRTHVIAPRAAVKGSSLVIRVAVDGAGNSLIVWVRVNDLRDETFKTTSVHVRRLTATGALGARVRLPSGGGLSLNPGIAVSASGRGMIVWDHVSSRYSIRAAAINRNGKVGKVRDIVEGLGGAPDIAVDSAGNATIVWVYIATQPPAPGVAARRIRVDGELGPVHILAPEHFDHVENLQPRVGVDPAGNATVAWKSSAYTDMIFSNFVASRRIGADEAVGPLVNLSGPGENVGFTDDAPEVAVDAAGNSTVGWQRLQPPAGNGSYAIQTRGVAPGGTSAVLSTLASASCQGWPHQGFCRAFGPKLAADRRSAFATWLDVRPGTHSLMVMLARFVPDGGN